MIAVDTSALVAVLIDEPQRPRIERLLLKTPVVLIGAPTIFELTMVTVSYTHLRAHET